MSILCLTEPRTHWVHQKASLAARFVPVDVLLTHLWSSIGLNWHFVCLEAPPPADTRTGACRKLFANCLAMPTAFPAAARLLRICGSKSATQAGDPSRRSLGL